MIGTNFDPLEENLPDGWYQQQAHGSDHPVIQDEDELYHERFTRLQEQREANWARENRDLMQRAVEQEQSLRRQAEAEIRRLKAMLHTVGINPLKRPAP